MKFCLFNEITIAENLSYDDAVKLLDKTDERKIMQNYLFSMRSKHGKPGWSVIARDMGLSEEFLKQPEAFQVEI